MGSDGRADPGDYGRAWDKDKQIWITEYGAPTHEDEGSASEERQAEPLVAGVALARETPWVGPQFWYSYRDLGDDPEYSEDWFGLIAKDGRSKSARAVTEEILARQP